MGGETGEKPSEEGENQWQTQPTYGMETQQSLGHTGERPLQHACFPLKYNSTETTGATEYILYKHLQRQAKLYPVFLYTTSLSRK